jgi:hypothetical protein
MFRAKWIERRRMKPISLPEELRSGKQQFPTRRSEILIDEEHNSSEE